MDRESRDPGRPEIWAGIECTVNRVGDRYFDQCLRTGHDRRADDIERLAGLGIRALRYPILWEKHGGSDSWNRTTERLDLLRQYRVRPIAGLVHHGSGPNTTSLLDPGFPVALAEYAGQVARRFPGLDAYTPVNEPLTTARFSALYGCWYPHATDDRSFARALLNQCRAVVLAMEAIRRVNPGAELVQTEDLGHTHAPRPLAYQADFENHRRWLTWDLLTGRFDRSHPLWDYLHRHLGFRHSELMWFADHPCPPDVIGVNYYITSERYLDDRLDRYPPVLHGGNGRDSYADLEAVRILPEGGLGLKTLLERTWERYRIPVAVTEAHLGCSREEQLRWLRDCWNSACSARRGGADIRAVTAWSAFGAYDWDSLVTRDDGNYESGLFDVRADPPRPTALARAVREMAASGRAGHPVLADEGWWKRPCRLLEAAGVDEPPCKGVPILLTDGDCRFGKAFLAACRQRGLSCVSPGFDRCDPTSIHAILRAYEPWAVIDTGGYPRKGAAEADPRKCRRATGDYSTSWAEGCRRADCKLVAISSDFVFDGRLGRPYRESDEVSPLNPYGAAKAEAERATLTAFPEALVVRTGLVYGKCRVRDFLSNALRVVHEGGQFSASESLTTSVAYLPDLVHGILDLLIDDERGIVHLCSPEAISWADLAKEAVRLAGLDARRVNVQPAPALGPVAMPLVSERGMILPKLVNSLERFTREVDWRAAA
jgi:dTDP-4-dehydrorhamnose reductase